ncbi:acyltransferase family protein [Pseudorhodoplanes sinuspersici]|nr:acyltransferase [Pseudorhodoplanes sinuspersici]RKE68183.1 peptidoglycan/LPS O-acetylase OafA/YrhL [Pseudorhodoplanes sinuspersici]
MFMKAIPPSRHCQEEATARGHSEPSTSTHHRAEAQPEAPRLSDVLEHTNNNFNAVRLLAALSVVVSHSFLLVIGLTAAEPLSSTPYTLGQHAVNVFFVLSGLMLSRSFAIQPNWQTFGIARALRIFPGLFVCATLVAWMLGPFGTRLSIAEYFHDGHTLTYPFATLIIFDRAQLHDMFLSGTHPGEINEPLWTLKYEVFAYIVFAVGMSLGLITKRSVIVLGCLMLATALTLANSEPSALSAPPIGSFVRFGFCFALGIVAYRYRAKIKLSWTIAGGFLALAFVTNGTPAANVTFIFSFAYAALVLGSIRIPRVTKFTSKTDLSFGLYIYAWPIQQLVLVAAGPAVSVWAHLTISLVLSLLFATFSWGLVEKPALSLKSRLKRSADLAAPHEAPSRLPNHA